MCKCDTNIGRLETNKDIVQGISQILLSCQHTNSAYIRHLFLTISKDDLLSRAPYCKSGRRAPILFNPERLYNKEGSRGTDLAQRKVNPDYERTKDAKQTDHISD